MSQIWVELSDDRRIHLAASISDLINEELKIDKDKFRIAPRELDGYYTGRFALPPQVAKYADEAAYQNGIISSASTNRSRWVKALILPAAVLMAIGSLGFLIPLPFDWGGRYETALYFIVPGFWFALAAVVAQVYS